MTIFIPIKKTLKRFLFLCLFVMLTYLVAHLHVFMMDRLNPMHNGTLPVPNAIEVSTTTKNEKNSTTVLDQLRLFYWYGP
ncbi:DUF4227 family protein [Longirhabdus pacifica]|uniref:DUF4227 family protein n=1 Tax=Longirhabdus pacifica TaxID=2305227 RepID=UPI001008D9CB|nr:DUF4227 family protein [Longirhabdus pacifica]